MESPTASPDTEVTTEALVELARSVQYSELPDVVVRRTGLYVLDWLGVAIRGSATPAARLARAVIAGGRSDGEAAVIGEEVLWLHPQDAALLNGVASHALDYDDGSGTGGLPHSGVTILPTLLALAQLHDSPGHALVAAAVAGQELGVRVAAIMEPEHYARGFHNLATTGMFSSASAGAHLLQLTPSQWRAALGIAGSLAGGLRASFGTMTKSLHAGRAANGAVLACLLAQRGFTANPNIVEARNGYAQTMTDTPHLEGGPRPLGRPFVVEGMRFKLHASCTGTQSTIDAIRALCDEGLSPDEVGQIQIAVHPVMLDICGVIDPQTGLQAKFSIYFAAALALHNRDTSEDGFSGQSLQDSLLRQTMDRVQLVPLREPRSSDDTVVTITTTDGRILRRRHRFADNRLDMDTETEVVTEKFVRLVSGLLPANRIDAVAQSALAVHTLGSVRELTELLSEASTGVARRADVQGTTDVAG